MVAAFGLYFIIGHYFPKSVGRYPFFVLLFLADLYLYSSYHKKIWSWKKIAAWLISTLYWIPAIMVGVILVGSVIYDFNSWDKYFKNYLVGFILIGYVAKSVPILFLAMADVIRIVRKRFRLSEKKQKDEGKAISRSLFLKRLGLIGGGLMFATLTIGMFKWVFDFKLWRKSIKIPGLPDALAGFKIVQFSDIHLGSWLSKNNLEEAVLKMNGLNPDVILFTGDLVNYETGEAFEFEEALKKLYAKYGIFCILGNHDYGDYKRWESKQAKQDNMSRLFDFYNRLGWNLLRNENFILQRGNDKMAIIGVENWGSMSRFQKYGDLDEAIQGVQSIPVKILLSHDPSHWDLKVRNYPVNIDITLSGHTHGAQFGFEFPGIRWSPSQYIYKHWAGLYSEINKTTGNLQYLYVNRGIGTIGYPGRVGINPEITLIELQPSDG